MRGENIITLIFIFVFIVLPILSNIVQAIRSLGAKRTPQDVQDYLNKMRKEQQARSRQDAHKTTGKGGQSASRRSKDYSREKPEEVRPILVMEQGKQTVSEKPRAPIADAVVQQKSIKEHRMALTNRVLENKRWNSLQKAIICREVFGKPKSLTVKQLL